MLTTNQMLVWDAAKSSTYRCQSINARNIDRQKRKFGEPKDTIRHWFRDELRRDCERMWGKKPGFPQSLRKREYAAALVIMRGMRHLGRAVTRRLIKSDTCCICKETLDSPIFRCGSTGYHLVCIRNYMLISHVFKDPIIGRAYTDEELQWCDTMSERHTHYRDDDGSYKPVTYDREDRSLYVLCHDPERIRLDHQARLDFEEIEVINGAISDALNIIEHSTIEFDVSFVTEHIRRCFRSLAYISVETARTTISDAINQYVNQPIMEVLVDIQSDINSQEEEQTDDDDDFITFGDYTRIPFRVQNMISMMGSALHRHIQSGVSDSVPFAGITVHTMGPGAWFAHSLSRGS